MHFKIPRKITSRKGKIYPPLFYAYSIAYKKLKILEKEFYKN